MNEIKIEVVNLSKCVRWDWNMPNNIYIGRKVPRLRISASPWGNPYRGKDAIKRYADNLDFDHLRATLHPIVRDVLRRGLATIRLGCWCAPAPCHGDVLKTIIERWIRTGEFEHYIYVTPKKET